LKIDRHVVNISGDVEYSEKVTMQLDEGAAAMILNNLISMYSNPYVAAMREYTSNAYDSHVEAGQTRAVELTLPSGLSPNLVIRDYGIGMSREGLRRYSQFGVSSKRDTNDQIGGFGIGSKSGLAMAPQFTVTAVKDGKRNTVVIGRREDGHPEMSMLAEQDVPDTEQNGVIITLPSTNGSRFLSAINDYMFVGWPQGSLKISGVKDEDLLSVYDTDEFTDLAGLGWMRREPDPTFDDTYNGKALVGPVLYKIKWGEIESSYNMSIRQRYLSRIVVKLDNGSVDLTPSREELQYTKRTRKAIQERVDAIIAEGQRTYQTQMDTAENMREALRFSRDAELAGFVGPYSYKGKIVKPAPTGDHQFTHTRVLKNRSSTVRASYDGMQMRYFDHRVINSLLGAKHAILVPDAGDGKDVRYNFRHDAAGVVATYIRAQAEKLSVDVADIHVVFTTEPENKLDPWVAGVFTQVVDVATYLSEAEAFRKEIMSRARANRAAATPKAKVTDPPVRVVTKAVEGGSGFFERGLSTVDTAKTYILLQNENPTLSTEDAKFYAEFRSALMTISGWHNSSSEMRTLVRLIVGSAFEVIVANKTMNVKKYSPTLTFIPLRDALNHIITTQNITLTPLQRTAAQDQANRDMYWAAYLRDKHIKNVNRDETREWLTEYQNKKLSNMMASFAAISAAVAAYKLDGAQYSVVADKPVPSPAGRYPLLAHVGYGVRDANKDVIAYINMIDALDSQPVT
jgi:hypothetical protein